MRRSNRLLRVVVRFPRLDALSVIIARVRRMFDLSAEPGAIAAVLSCDPVLRRWFRRGRGCACREGGIGFEIAVRAVLGQQITVKAATQLAGGLWRRLGTESGGRCRCAGLTHAFPRPEQFDVENVGRDWDAGARAAAIAGVAAAIGGG